MNTTTVIIDNNHPAEQLDVLGTQIDLIHSAAENESFSVTLQSGAEKVGPPPHSHDWDEAFFVIEGQVNFEADGKRACLGPGSYVHIPAGTVHAFSFAEGGGRMLEITGTKSKSTELFRQLNNECASTPPVMSEVARVFSQNQVALHI